MREAATLQRGLERMALDLPRQFANRAQAMRQSSLCERMQEFQHDFSGTVGTVPAEITFQILFDILFLGDAGCRRDSQLGEPQFSHGVHLLSAPSGTIIYAYVPSWVQDDDFNFTGANVTIGVHNPRIAEQGVGAVGSVRFQGTLHSTFHGFGLPIDPEGDGDGGGNDGQ